MKIIVAGASGLVGGEVVAQADALGVESTLVGRRSLGEGEREIITDFGSAIELPPADAAICTLGTTIAKAGSRRAFYAVDHDAVMTFAESALAANIPHFLVVTAIGADAKAPVYYSRVKGEVERSLEGLGFRRLDIAQPGLLLGSREERRPMEALFQAANPLVRRLLVGPLDRYAGIEAAVVAEALLGLCASDMEPGVFRHENRQLRLIAA